MTPRDIIASGEVPDAAFGQMVVIESGSLQASVWSATMRKLFPAIVLSLALSVGLVPGLAFAAQGDGLAPAGSADAPVALSQQSSKTPKVTVRRAAKGEVAIKKGKAYKLGAETTVGKLSYKSSNEKVATVTQKGTVEAKKVGKATITITAKNGTKKASKKVAVTVLSAKKYKAVKKLKVILPHKSLRVGMTDEALPVFSPSNASNQNVVYKSSNPKVLSVNAKGMVKALKVGKAKITVTSCDNPKAKVRVSVDVEKRFLLDRSKWKARMNLPTNKQMNEYLTTERAPYIVCWPQFAGTTGYTEYAVDFKADSQPRETYVNIGSWIMDTSSLKKRYTSIGTDEGNDPGIMYAGFQVLEDGRKVAIMSAWKLFLVDKDGKKSVLDAKRTYPEKPRVGSDFGGEGTGVKTIVDYDWKAGNTYRALIQLGTTAAGNCEVQFSVCDLKTGEWTKLISYDLGYGDTYMKSMGCFLENYDRHEATEIRTAEWSNFRAKSREDGSWVSAKSAKMERQFEEWPGSYSFGSDGPCFWAITSGVPNLCKPPADGTIFNVSKAKSGQPYEE